MSPSAAPAPQVPDLNDSSELPSVVPPQQQGGANKLFSVLAKRPAGSGLPAMSDLAILDDFLASHTPETLSALSQEAGQALTLFTNLVEQKGALDAQKDPNVVAVVQEAHKIRAWCVAFWDQ